MRGREQIIVVREPLPQWNTRLFRIVKASSASEEATIDSLRSHYELGMIPRTATVRPAVLNMALSMYRNQELARKAARQWPRIGRYIAELELVSGKGFNIADTGHPGHVSVWGDPLELLERIVDIVPVED
jgi:hypothetical protein